MDLNNMITSYARIAAKVVEFCDPRIQQIKDMVGELLKFKVTYHSLNLYGHCDGACERTQKKE